MENVKAKEMSTTVWVDKVMYVVDEKVQEYIEWLEEKLLEYEIKGEQNGS